MTEGRNGRLRSARERTESTVCAGRQMTQSELAELVNRYVWDRFGQVVEVDDNYVAKLERGVIRWPNKRYREAFRAILGAATDADLGFWNQRSAPVVQLEDVDRSQFLRGGIAGLGLLASARIGRSNVIDARSQSEPDARDDLVSMLGAPTASYRRMEAEIPSRALVPAVDAHYRLARSLVADSRSAAGFAALSEIAGLSAWLAYDVADTATARDRYTHAVKWAEATGDRLLVSYMQGSLGHFAVDTGDATYGLTLLDRAHGEMPSVAPPSAHAWVQSLRAVALAELGDANGSRAALKEAEKLSAKPTEPTWPFMFSFDGAKAARWRGAALMRLGEHDAAIEQFAVTESAPSAPKPHALVLVDQAQSWAGTGDVTRACDLASRALDLGASYGSERVVARVRVLRRTLPVDTGDVESLDDRLATLYTGHRT